MSSPSASPTLSPRTTSPRGSPPADVSVAPPVLDYDNREKLQDRAVCAEARDRVVQLEDNVLELKARDLALRMRSPTFTSESLQTNPGSDVSEASRGRFYRL